MIWPGFNNHAFAKDRRHRLTVYRRALEPKFEIVRQRTSRLRRAHILWCSNSQRFRPAAMDFSMPTGGAAVFPCGPDYALALVTSGHRHFKFCVPTALIHQVPMTTDGGAMSTVMEKYHLTYRRHSSVFDYVKRTRHEALRCHAGEIDIFPHF
jgi:hypothetical protein